MRCLFCHAPHLVDLYEVLVCRQCGRREVAKCDLFFYFHDFMIYSDVGSED